MLIANFGPTAVSAQPCVFLPDRRYETDTEIDRLTSALSEKFEEISLIHELTERLRLDEDASSLCKALLERLLICLDAETLAIDLVEDLDSGFEAQLHQAGTPMPEEHLRRIAATARAEVREGAAGFGRANRSGLVIANACRHPFLTGRRVVVIPIERREGYLGELTVIRSTDQEEFGTVEIDLIRSTLMMLAVHLVNQRQFLEMQQMFEGTVRSLVSALDAKDAYTCGHSSRVSTLAVALARRLGYTDDELARIHMAGILHDIGKIGVEDSVLRKPGRLTDEEFAKIKAHPALGYEILKGIRPFRNILPAVRHHHESWDGSGYPDGLEGEAIPRDAQIIAVADAFDAMTSDRPYRKGMPLEKVVAIFEKGRGTQWAADVVDAFLDSSELLEEFAGRRTLAEASVAEAFTA